MRNGLIMMTALPPTKGHEYLIRWARSFLSMHPEGGSLYVVVYGLESDPIPAHERAELIEIQIGFDPPGKVRVASSNDRLPREPGDHPDFWGIWERELRARFNPKPGDFIFASDLYGQRLADDLGITFVPCDIGRLAMPCKATAIRRDPTVHFEHLTESYQRKLRRRVTFFGAESVGKTTASHAVAERLKCTWVPEWARGYLETVGHAVTDERMEKIVLGQFAAQATALKMAKGPFIIQDTDLLSTLGYYRIYRGKETKDCLTFFRMSKSDLYILMNHDIPFTPDRLRYGGDRRESSVEFWVALLEEFGCRYRRVRSADPTEQVEEIVGYLREDYANSYPFVGYERI
jgi:HTH-type transcriptional repressor of NAD biosynthesis genes